MEYSPNELQQLRDLIRAHFSEDELRMLCIELNIDFDELRSLGTQGKSWELIRYMQRRSRLDELVDYCWKVRPTVSWPGKAAASVSAPSDPVTHLPAYSAYVETTKLRLDAALPGQVQQHVSFELAVTIRQPNSPILKDEELDKTATGDLQVTWPEEAESVAVRVHLHAPECQIHGDDSWSFRLKKEHDSPVHYFQLTPRQAGRIGMVLTIYQEQEWLGSTRLHTLAQEQVAGQVAVNVYSQPLDISHTALVNVGLALAQYFSPEELNELCWALHVPYNDIPGESHKAKARELVTYLVRRGRFIELITQCQQERPHVNWYQLTYIEHARGPMR